MNPLENNYNSAESTKNEMSKENMSNIPSINEENKDSKESLKDIKNSIILLRDNYSAFFKTEIFAVISGIIISILIILILYLIMFFFNQFSFEEFMLFMISKSKTSLYFRFFTAFMNQLVFSIFLRTQFGLAYDIMSSGDMFTEFKNIFRYFKKHWWQYVIFDLITLGLPILVRFSLGFFNLQNNEIEIRGLFFYGENVIVGLTFACTFILLSGVLPSLTRQGSLIQGFKENFRLIKNNYKRILRSWGLFFLIFEIPAYILSVFVIMYYYLLAPILVAIIVLGIASFNLLVLFPLSTLIATGIYNNSHFDRVRPDL